MPWVSRPRARLAARLFQVLRRWRYDHSEEVVAFGIGAVIVALAAAAAVVVLIS